MMSSDTPCALILGASGEIGGAIARALRGEGYGLILGYRDHEERARNLAEDLTTPESPVRVVQVDVREKDQMEEAVNLADTDGRALWVLVNSAGLLKEAFLTFMKDEDWDETLDVNLKGAFVATRAAAKAMVKRRAGRIIHISSVAGLQGDVMRAHYSASKAGVIGLVKASARELARRGITVNAVAPGMIDTKMIDLVSDEKKKAMTERIPMRRFGTANEVAAAVRFLASPGASYFTGQVLCVDGGLSC